MAAEIINLRKARKQKVRAAAETAAAQNRISFGRTKAEREATSAESTLQRKRHDQHILDGNSPDDRKPGDA